MNRLLKALIITILLIVTAVTLFSCNADTVSTYTVSFETDGGNSIPAVTVSCDSIITMPSDPVKEGYTFAGWFLDNDTFLESADTIIEAPLAGNITIYAKWLLNNLIFDANGGNCDIKSIYVAIGNSINLPENTLYRDCYIFKGWSLLTGGEVAYQDNSSYTMESDAVITLYAVWEFALLFEVAENKITITGLKEGYSTNTLTIPSEINVEGSLLDVVGIDNDAFKDKTFLNVVSFPNSIIYVGANILTGCSNLTEITVPFMSNYIPNTNSYLEYYFGGIDCYSNITIPTELKTINFSNEPVALAENIFSHCKYLTNVIIPDSVNNIGINAFFNCISLTNITIPSAVLNIGSYAFDNCPELANVTIPNGVIGIGTSAFSGCKRFTDITIPDSVTRIGSSAFSNCINLAVITIPNSVTKIGSSAFRNCINLTAITIPSSVTKLEDGIFDLCKSLMSITLEAITPPSLNDLYYTTLNYVKIYVPAASVSSYKAATGWCDYANKIFSKTVIDEDEFAIEEGVLLQYLGSETDIMIPSGITGIDDYAFYGNKRISSVIISDTVLSIGISAFEGCSGLIGIIIPDSVTFIDSSVFYGCTNLEDITVSEDNSYYKSIDGVLFDKAGTTLMQYAIANSRNSYTIPETVIYINDRAFQGCSNVSSIIITNGVLSIGKYVFSDCICLTDITIADSVTSIDDYAFSGCICLTDLVIPDSVTSIGDYAFRKCTGLTSIVIPDTTITIGKAILSGCTNLTEITVPLLSTYSFNTHSFIGYYWGMTTPFIISSSQLTTINISNEISAFCDYAFAGCAGITNLTIPESVTNIGAFAFQGCIGLTSIIIPESVTSIGDCAFFACRGLTNVNIPSSVTSIGSSIFRNCNNLEEITVSEDNPSYISFDGVIFNIAKTSLIQYAIGNSRTYYAIPDSVIIIGDGAFGGCANLERITIPDSVTELGNNTFIYCTHLTEIIIPSNVTIIGNYTFYNCISLTDIIIPDNITRIDDYAFSCCTGLTEVTIPDSVISMGYFSFWYCSNLNLIIPDSVIIDDPMTTITFD